MPSPLKFHLDECIFSYQVLAGALRRKGIDVTTAADVNLLSAPDHIHLRFAVSQQRALFTFDADYLEMAGLPIEHAGIIYCHQRKHSFSTIIRLLIMYWETYSSEELLGKLEYL